MSNELADKYNTTVKAPLKILLADDDKDDRFFFDKALKSLPFPTQLTTVEDGEQLMDYLSENSDNLPDILFLDINMPRKNGFECLSEIKKNPKLKEIPVIIYSTSLHEDIANQLYSNGAHFYIQKTDLDELEKILHLVLTMMIEGKFKYPAKENFILNIKKASIK